jgi:hypothetical protein
MPIDIPGQTPSLPIGTWLVLSVGGVPLYSARGLDQTLQPIDAAHVTRRTINGTLIDLSVDKFHKYQSKITCSDVEAPAMDGVFPGMAVTVDCVAELVYRTTGGTPSRTVIAGSARTVGDFTIYRPRLDMMVVGFNQSISEYARTVQWELDLEER